MWQWFGIFSKSSDTYEQNLIQTPGVNTDSMGISPQYGNVMDAQKEMPSEISQPSTVDTPMLENVIVNYRKNLRYFPFKYFKPTLQDIEEQSMTFSPSHLQEQTAIQEITSQKNMELNDLQRPDFPSSHDPCIQSSLHVTNVEKQVPLPIPPTSLPIPPSQIQAPSQTSKLPALSQTMSSLPNHPNLTPSNSESSIPPPNASNTGSRKQAIICAPRFMMKVLEALRELQTKACCCKVGSTANEIGDYIVKHYVVDGDVRAQVRIGLRLAHVSGLVAYIQHTGLYTLATPSIADMSVSKRRYQRFLRRRRDTGLFKPTRETSEKHIVTKKSRSKSSSRCYR